MSFKRLDQEDISISAESVVGPLWSTGTVNLTEFHTGSQVSSNTGNYYYDVSEAVTTGVHSTQFSVAFGHKTGAGAVPYNAGASTKTPSSTIYGQYRNLVLGSEDSEFTFGTVSSDHIYIINVDRARYKEKLFPGTFNLKLKYGAKTLELTDNSRSNTTISFVDSGRVYEIISGSNGVPYPPGGTGYTTSNGSYGKFLPDVGIIVLNGKALDDATDGLNLNTYTAQDGAGSNLNKIFTAINDGNSFSLQSEETISSNYVFVRVRNGEFNYSTNPSIITGSGELRYDVLVNQPQAYMTTVGLYNDNNDLVAVAKLSRPLLKDFTKEALIRIKLDY